MSIARIAEKIENPSVTQLLATYPNKEKFDEAVRAGRIKPTTEAGVAANIFNRIVADALAKQARIQGEKTVFQELTAPQGMGLGAIAPGMDQGMGMGMGMGMGQPPQPPMQPPAPQGLDQIPVPDQMFQPQGMAGGGIVAFSDGGRSLTRRGFRGVIEEDPEEEIVRRLTRRGLRPSTEGVTPSFTGALSGQQALGIQGFGAAADTLSGPAVLPPPPPPPPPPSGERPAAIPAAPTSAVPGLREQLMGRIGEAYPDLAGGVKPTEPSVKGIFQERAEAERIAGVDKDFFKNEARNIVKQRDELKGDKKEAANMRLIEAGLRIMGGESPYAFVNIGKGASEALKGFADDIKDIQKTKREYDKAERELRTAEQLYARNKSDEALKEVQRRRELAQDRNTSFQTAMMKMEKDLATLGVQEAQVRVQEKAAARPSELERMIRLATDPNATEDQRKLARGVIEQRGGASQQATLQLRALNELLTSKQDQLFATKDKQAKQKIQEEINSIQGQIRSIGGLGGAGSADPELLRRADAILGIR